MWRKTDKYQVWIHSMYYKQTEMSDSYSLDMYQLKLKAFASPPSEGRGTTPPSVFQYHWTTITPKLKVNTKAWTRYVKPRLGVSTLT